MVFDGNKLTSKLIFTCICTLALLSGCKNEKVNNSNLLTAGNDNYVAVVGTEKITNPEFYYFLHQTEMMAETDNESSETSRQLYEKEIKEKALESAVEFKINLKKANKELTKDEKESVKKEFESTFKDDAQELDGIKQEEYKAIYFNELLVQEFDRKKRDSMKIENNELLNYLNKNKSKYEVVQIEAILFFTKNEENGQLLPRDKQELAKKNGEDVIKRIKAGENIEELAPELTEEPDGATVGGGYMISRDKRKDEPELVDWAFSSKLGDIDMVKTQRGYYVAKKTYEPTDEEQKESAKQDLVDEIMKNEMKEEKNRPENAVIKNEAIY